MLGENDDGVPSTELVDVVRAALSSDRVRPLTEDVTVQAVEIVPYTIEATLTIESGPSLAVVRDAALDAARALVHEHNVCGGTVRVAAVTAALFVPGVTNVALTSPTADVTTAPEQAPWCTDGAADPYTTPTTHPMGRGINLS